MAYNIEKMKRNLNFIIILDKDLIIFFHSRTSFSNCFGSLLYHSNEFKEFECFIPPPHHHIHHHSLNFNHE